MRNGTKTTYSRYLPGNVGMFRNCFNYSMLVTPFSLQITVESLTLVIPGLGGGRVNGLGDTTPFFLCSKPKMLALGSPPPQKKCLPSQFHISHVFQLFDPLHIPSHLLFVKIYQCVIQRVLLKFNSTSDKIRVKTFLTTKLVNRPSVARLFYKHHCH